MNCAGGTRPRSACCQRTDRIPGEIQTQRDFVARPRHDMAHHDRFVTLSQRLDRKTGFSGAARSGFESFAFTGGDALGIVNDLNPGITLRKIQRRDVSGEFPARKTTVVGPMQRAHAHQYFGVTAHARFNGIPGFVADDRKALSRLTPGLQARRIPDDTGQQQAGSQYGPYQPAVSAIQRIVAVRKIQIPSRSAGRLLRTNLFFFFMGRAA